MTPARRLVLVVALTVGALTGLGLVGAPAASAHPLGNFTVNRYSGIVLSPGRIQVGYVMDLAEIPTFQELPNVDSNGDGHAGPAERRAWAGREAGEILSNLDLVVEGDRVPLSLDRAEMELLAGQGGLQILHLRAVFTASLPDSGTLAYRDANDPGRIGWREVTARSEPGVSIVGSDVPEATVSGELRSYPEDLLSSPLAVTHASLSFRPGSGSSTGQAGTPGGSSSPGPSEGTFAGLITRPLTPGVLVLSLLLAFVFGALHALGPGHGKTIMAAYLVGAGAKLRNAAMVGVAVTLMHTASVLALGLIALYASRFFPADRVYPWLSVLTGGVVLALGIGLLVSRVRARRGVRGWHGHSHAPAAEDERIHQVEPEPRRGLSRKGVAALAISGGVLPSPTALVVLLGSIALHRPAYGLALIALFSLGLAAALMAVGVVALRARSFVDRRIASSMTGWLPLGSAVVIVAVGAFLSLRAFLLLG